jgi:transposase
VALDPILILLKAHVLRAGRIHADDTTVPVLAKGKTTTGRLWAYVRDDRPFGGKEAPAAFFEYSRNRAGEHPQRHLAGWTGIMQADAYDGYNALYAATRRPAPVKEAGCWAHWRRKLFDLAKLTKAPIAAEAVRRMDELFAFERTIAGKPPDERVAARRTYAAPLTADLRDWLIEQRKNLSAKSDTAKEINYGLSRWEAFTRFLDDGYICLTNNAAERALRGIAMRESLCTPSSSICKHWKRVHIDNATRATLPGQRRFHRLRRELGGPDLMRCAWNNLHGMKNARFDQAPYRMVRDA